MTRPRRMLIGGLILLGLAGLGVFGAFVVLLGLGLWSPLFRAPESWALWVNLGWLLVFAVQHSGMARTGFKDWWVARFSVELERPVYVALSGLLVLGLALTWQPVPGPPRWDGPPWITVIAILGATGAVAVVAWTGWRPFLGWSDEPGQVRLIVTGPYRYLRHPQMLGTLIFLWAHPVLSSELLLLAGGLTGYILLALPLEERDLRRRFGKDYEEYRARVWP